MEGEDLYRVYKSQPLVPVMSQMNPSTPSHLTLFRATLILFCHLRLRPFSGHLLSNFPNKTLYTFRSSVTP